MSLCVASRPASLLVQVDVTNALFLHYDQYNIYVLLEYNQLTSLAVAVALLLEFVLLLQAEPLLEMYLLSSNVNKMELLEKSKTILIEQNGIWENGRGGGKVGK